MSWYCHQNLKPQGPFNLAEIRLKIMRGEVGPQDLLLNEEADEWKPAMAWGVFEFSLFPALQSTEERGYGRTDWKSAEWVLLREVQEGPYSLSQLLAMLRKNEISIEMYIWKSGLSGWVQIKDRPEFTAEVEQISKASAKAEAAQLAGPLRDEKSI